MLQKQIQRISMKLPQPEKKMTLTATMTMGNAATGSAIEGPTLTKIMRPAEKTLVKQPGEKVLVKQISGRGMRTGNDGRPLPMPGQASPQRKPSQLAAGTSSGTAPVSPAPATATGAGGAAPAPASAPSTVVAPGVVTSPTTHPDTAVSAVAVATQPAPVVEDKVVLNIDASLSKEDQKRMQIVREILNTEQSYVDNLNVVKTRFIGALRKAGGMEDLIRQIYGNIELIAGFNEELLSSLEQRIKGWTPESKIGDIFLRLGPFLKMYNDYSSNFHGAVDLHFNAVKTNRVYASTVAPLEQAAKNNEILALNALLIQPIQRIPRYKLLLEDLLKNTDGSHPDHRDLEKAVSQIKGVADHLNESVRKTENSQILLQFSPVVRIKLENLLLPHRHVITTGAVSALIYPLEALLSSEGVDAQKVDEKKKNRCEMRVVVFNDLIAAIRETKDVKDATMYHWPLVLTWLNENPETKKKKCFEIFGPDYVLRCYPTSKELVATWTQKLRRIVNSVLCNETIESPDRIGEHMLPDGSVYNGQWARGLRHGQGSMTMRCGSTYEGAWVKCLRTGEGRMKYVTGGVYQGDWLNDQPHGKGVLRLPGEGVYQGDFVNGKREGEGVMRFEDGSEYQGTWMAGLFAKGTLKSSDGATVYSGTFVNNRKDGKGVLTKNGEVVYDGVWKRNLPETNGFLKDSLGTFKGGFSLGRRQGIGIQNYTNGFVYQGVWEADMPNGQGNLTGPNGVDYDGEWQAGVRHGFGKATLANKDVYEGQWCDGLPHGEGTYSFANGVIFSGMFNRGSRAEGLCTLTKGDVVVRGTYSFGTVRVRGEAVEFLAPELLSVFALPPLAAHEL